MRNVEIKRSITKIIQATTIMLCLLGASAMAGERDENMEVIESFLTHPDISEAMTDKHGKNIAKLMKKVSKLDDEQLQNLADDTHKLIQFGAASGTQRFESKTAENIADKWLKLGYLAVLLPVALLFLLIL